MAKGKELKFTKGYNQDELNAWWKANGLPGSALTIPEFLLGKNVGKGRDAYGIYDMTTGDRQSYKDLNKAYGADSSTIANRFRNDLGSFSDPFREQSGISKVAGGVLDIAKVAIPGLALMDQAAKAGNKALGNNDPPDFQGILEANHAANGSPGQGTDVLGPLSMKRERTTGPVDYRRYGMGPEHAFFKPVEAAAPPVGQVPVGVAPPTRVGSGFGGALADRIRGIAAPDPRAALAGGGALSTARHYPPRPKGRPSQELLNFASLPGQRQDPRVRVAVGESGPLSQFVSKGTGAGGREDNIDAKLSENEYVIDAETVALLGDGSPEAGAKKLDAMRGQIRRHKGQALAKGKISPHAKEGALQYLAKGGKVGGAQGALRSAEKIRRSARRAQLSPRSLTRENAREILRLQGWPDTDRAIDEMLAGRNTDRAENFQMPGPKTFKEYAEGGRVGVLSRLFKKRDPNANLRRINAALEEALKRKPEPERPQVTSEELNRDVAALRREVGAQGGDTRPLGRARGGALTNYRGGK